MKPQILLSLLALIAGTSFLTPSSTQQVQPLGTVIGHQTVVSIPIAPPDSTTAQALIFYPDDYFHQANASKRYPLYVFLHGAGEGTSDDITEVTNTSLPQLIAAGLRPYGIDPVTHDTIKYIVVSPHCAGCGGSYSYPQLQYVIPYLFTAYRVDTANVWVGGPSSGGRGSWSVVIGDSLGDTTLGKRITGIMPMANGGYDDKLNAMGPNLDTIARRGLATLYTIGDQDPGYNADGFFAYQAAMQKYSQPGKYHDTVITGGTHGEDVWTTPFPEDARTWSPTMNAWTQMWSLRKNASAPVTPPTPGVHVTKTGCTEYKAAYLYSDSIVRSFSFNNGTGRVEFLPYPIGDRKAVDISTGFNRITILDDQGFVWQSDAGLNSCSRWSKDANGHVFDGNVFICGYFQTFLSIRDDGTIWYWGTDDYQFYAGTAQVAPIKINQPAGVKFVSLAAGNVLLGLTSTGDVYQWNKGNINYVKVNLPRPACSIASSQLDFHLALVTDGNASDTVGYPYAWGSESQHWGGTGTSYPPSAPIALRVPWQLTVPINRLRVSDNSIIYIDANRDMFGIGDNANGEVGNGQELVNHAEKYPTPYAWSWTKNEFLTGPVPIHIAPGIKFKSLSIGGPFTFYHYARDVNDSIYFWGRNKSFVGGDGAVNIQESTYPNALDVLTPSMRTPIGVTADKIVSYNFTKYTLRAGPKQNITTTTAVLTAKGTPSTLTAPGRPNYGYTVVKYQWTKLSGPSCTIVSPNKDTSNVTGLTTGTYIFSIQMTDNNTATISAYDTIVVNGSGTTSIFVVDAGPDRTITLPTSSLTIAGVATVKNETPNSCRWIQVSGPSAVAITGGGSIRPTLTGLVRGTYIIQVVITSRSGLTARDSMTITVNAATAATAREEAIAGKTIIGNPGQTIGIKIYPNPVGINQQITIEGNSDQAGTVTIHIYDRTGRQVRQFSRKDQPAQFSQTIGLTGLTRGVYMLTVQTDGKTKPAVFSFVVQ